MTCPKCNKKTKVIDITHTEDAEKRKRECIVCGYRFTTIELDEDLFERLVERDGKTNTKNM